MIYLIIIKIKIKTKIYIIKKIKNKIKLYILKIIKLIKKKIYYNK